MPSTIDTPSPADAATDGAVRASRGRRLTAALLAGGLLLAAPACGSDGGDDGAAAEKAVEDMIEKETGQKVDLDTADGNTKIETEDGTSEIDLGIEGAELGTLPDGFPDDIDVEGLEVISGGTTEMPDGSVSMMVAFGSDNDINSVMKELGDRMGSWVLKGSSIISMESPRTQAVRYSKDGRLAAFTVSEQGSGTSILLNLSQE